MNKEEIRVTPVWQLYEIGRNYHRRTGIYTDTDRNFRFYNGNQWDGAKLGGVEPIQKNFIKPIVKYKVSVIHNHLYGIVYSSQNFDNPGNQKESGKLCEMLNRYAARAWEKDSMDFKGRRITKHSAINDEGILYINFDEETMTPVNEVISKSDIYYGNENDDDIQNQPYILIRRRMPVANAIDLALSLGMSEDDEPMIIGDSDTFEQSGEAAKEELDNMVTIVYKMYRKKGTVHFSAATRWVEIVNDVDTGLTLYPVAHFVWEEKEGSARGEGEVRYLIPNQIEVNRTEMRRVLTVKEQAYPMKVVDVSRVANPSALDTVGGTVRTNGQPVDDVRKIVGTIPPAQMSPDVKLLQDDLINVTRDLAGAGDTATGQVNPESASGRAILAVQQASQAPMTEQKESYKKFIEDVARICKERGIQTVLHSLPHRNDTVRLGLDAMPGIHRCMFAAADQPLLRKETIGALALASANDPDSIWRTVWDETPGSPVIFPKWTFPELQNLPEGKGGGVVIKKYPERLRTVSVRDMDELKDVDSPEDLRELLER